MPVECAEKLEGGMVLLIGGNPPTAQTSRDPAAHSPEMGTLVPLVSDCHDAPSQCISPPAKEATHTPSTEVAQTLSNIACTDITVDHAVPFQ